MKKLSIFFILATFLAFGSICLDSNAQVNINKLKNKAQGKLKPNDKKPIDKTTDDKKGPVKEETKDNNTEKEVKNLPPLKFDDANPTRLYYHTLLSNTKLEPETGVLKFSGLSVAYLPKTDMNGKEVQYDIGDGTYKITASLKLKGEELCKFAFRKLSSSYEPNKDDLNPTSGGDYVSSFTVTEGGDYSLEFKVEDKTIETLDIEILQAEKDGESSFYFKKPMNEYWYLDYKKPESYFSVRFFAGPKVFSKEYIKGSVALWKTVDNGKDEFIGSGEVDQYRDTKRWKESDMIVFKKPSSPTVYTKDVTANPGKYYITFYGNTGNFRYNFEVKDSKIISPVNVLEAEGKCWLKKKLIEMPKYEGFRPAGSFTSMKDNIRLGFKSNEGNTQNTVGAGKPVSFSDGQEITIYGPTVDQSTLDKFVHLPTQQITSLLNGNDIIAQKILFSEFNNPSYPYFAFDGDNITLQHDQVAFEFMEAMSKLPAGTHNLTLVTELQSGDLKKVTGKQSITFKSVNGNPIYAENAKLANERMNMSESELADVRFSKYGGPDWAMYSNNCGRVVWLRQDKYKEYYLFPGKQAKFDRNGGPMEQWNFGTLKWNSIDDFGASSTIYKLTDNEIAMLYLKLKVGKEEKAKDITDKLKPLAGKEFSSDIIYLAEVKKLIGEELTKKYEDQIILAANIDIVNICK